MLMNNTTDFLELLIGKNTEEALTAEGFVPIQERDQQLDMDTISYPTDESTLLDLYPFVDDTQCPQIVQEVVELPQESDTTMLLTEALSQLPQTSHDGQIFQFPPTPEMEQSSYTDSDIFPVTVEIIEGDIPDSESEYSVTVPSTPFSPSSSYSLPPPTPDTASSTSSGNVPAFVKSSLKMAIKSKRYREGKDDIEVEFKPPEPEQLTVEEHTKRVEKREKNKLAAQKCREKKRARIDELEDETKKLKKRQSAYRLEVQKLVQERDRLMDIINVHSEVCPNLRSHSTSF